MGFSKLKNDRLAGWTVATIGALPATGWRANSAREQWLARARSLANAAHDGSDRVQYSISPASVVVSLFSRRILGNVIVEYLDARRQIALFLENVH
jgi:hypothetical protein